MLKYLKKILNVWDMSYRNTQTDKNKDRQGEKLASKLKDNLNRLRGILGNESIDVVIREFSFGQKRKFNCALIYINGMTDTATVNQSIIKPLLYDSPSLHMEDLEGMENIEWIKTAMLAIGYLKELILIDDAIEECLSGNTLLLIDDSPKALAVGTQGWETRSIQEPTTEAVVRGPHEGFTESIGTNITLLRRKIHNTNLTMESMKIGDQTKTNVCVAYLKGTANPKLIEEIRIRLERIQIDGILESGYIEQLIEDAPYSPFATINHSERPDVIAAKLLEGRAAVMVDGTPFVLTMPMVFIEGFQSPEDYYSRPFYASILRLLRFASYLISILAPGVYVALTTHHHELLPTPLLISMLKAKEGTPFPSFVEALMMGMVFEIIREAGIRLPRPIGQTISIVGALVVGEAAVSAGLIGAPVVIMVAITSLCSFVVVALNESGVILRVMILLLSALLGGFGTAIGLLYILISLASLRSFGTPYLSPLAPMNPAGLKDAFVRAPLWLMLTRPQMIVQNNMKRLDLQTGPAIPPARPVGQGSKRFFLSVVSLLQKKRNRN